MNPLFSHKSKFGNYYGEPRPKYTNLERKRFWSQNPIQKFRRIRKYTIFHHNLVTKSNSKLFSTIFLLSKWIRLVMKPHSNDWKILQNSSIPWFNYCKFLESTPATIRDFIPRYNICLGAGCLIMHRCI